jgi:hypothetical protein
MISSQCAMMKRFERKEERFYIPEGKKRRRANKRKNSKELSRWGGEEDE